MRCLIDIITSSLEASKQVKVDHVLEAKTDFIIDTDKMAEAPDQHVANLKAASQKTAAEKARDEEEEELNAEDLGELSIEQLNQLFLGRSTIRAEGT